MSNHKNAGGHCTLKWILQLSVCLVSIFTSVGNLNAQDRILFIRGGTGTVGFLEGGSDEQGASIFNYTTSSGNHSWGELRAALVSEGFAPEEVTEDPVVGGVPTPVALDTMNLNVYDLIVFGSNNAEYSEAQVDALVNYVSAGGSALFISDANFGQNWGDAPSSDQLFLDRFGLVMNQDQGTYQIRITNEFVVPTHPILNGVDSFDGEGVSPITVPPDGAVSGVTRTLLTTARSNVRRNTGSARGPSEPATENDASLVVATLGSGRIACHFDRNTFFNLNGAGTNLNRFDNEAYARNLFNWLTGKPDFNPTTDNYSPRAHFPELPIGTVLGEGEALAVEVIAKDPDGSVASVELLVDGAPVSTLTTAPFEWSITGLDIGARVLTARVTDDDGAMTDETITVTVADQADSETPLDRSTWSLSGSPNNNAADLANAIDGNIGSRWATEQFQQAGQKFSLDLGERQMIQRIIMETPANPEDYPRGYIVRGSDDGVNFTEIVSGAGSDSTTDILFSRPMTYRYFEIEQTGSSGNRWWSIHEINLYKPPANSVLPYSSWSEFHFGTDLADPAKEGTHWGIEADLDLDGQNTLLEFASNTDPAISSSSFLPEITGNIDPTDNRPYIDITIRRWLDSTSAGISYGLEKSSTLSGWNTNGLEVEELGTPVSNRDGTETVTLRIKTTSDPTCLFLRRFIELLP